MQGPVSGKIHEHPNGGEIRVDVFSLQRREGLVYEARRG